MKVFVSVDMEGVSGVTDPEDVLPNGAEYQTCRRYMTGDANAAVAGAFDAGAEAVLVNDSHWIMRNLLVHDLDRRARVIKGFHKPLCMLQGLDASYGAAVFVGYHSCAGTEGGVLNHTMLGKEVQNIFLNGEPTGETRLNAGLAGHFGVPVALVAGDVAVGEEAKRVLPGVATVAVKDGIDKFSAVLKHPEVAQAEIREATAAALRSVSSRKPYVVKPPIRIGVEWNSTTIAQTCGLVPGVRVTGPRTTEYVTDDYPDGMKVLLVELLLALQVGQKAIYG
ncbi:MAG TPA: M55 family metallopeptidase [Candidatus Limnocylindrales bacterium]|nr:M55 family metallopeptidase [Candidatus Limnocylindrales bacterium]